MHLFISKKHREQQQEKLGSEYLQQTVQAIRAQGL